MNPRFRATLEARERNRLALVNALEDHCARERTRHSLYRVFLFLMICVVGYLWINRISAKTLEPFQNIISLLEQKNFLKSVQEELAANSHQVIGAPAQTKKVLVKNNRYDSERNPSFLPPELSAARNPKQNQGYVMGSEKERAVVKQASRNLASLPGYRSPSSQESRGLPSFKREEPIPQSRYTWVGHAVPLRLVVDSDQFPDINH